MKVIIGTQIVPIILFIILFAELEILLTSLPIFVYAQTVENDIIANTLETVEKATAGISDITESLNNASELIERSAQNTTESASNNATEDTGSAIAGAGQAIEESTDITTTSNRSIQYGQKELKNNNINWIIGESDNLSFKYPSHWDINVSDSRFDKYELIFVDKATNSSIRVSDEAISSSDKILVAGGDPTKYFPTYIMNNAPLSWTAKKIETYPKGKVFIAGLPAYSELYLDKGNAVLISLAFPEGYERHYTVLSSSPSSKYDYLEPIMLEIIKSITPKTIQKQLDQVEIPFNNTDSGNLSSTHDNEQLQKEDPIKRESLLSNTIKRNNTSDESQTIEQQQENDSLSESSIYEGLGLKMKYFDPWTIFHQFDDPTCGQINFCYIQLNIPISEGLENNAIISITQDKFESPKIKDECKCDTLQNYVRYQYENHVSTADNFSFINDNQTTIPNDNKPVIQLEYDLSLANGDNKGFAILTKNDQSFYHFTIVVNKNSQYSKYIDDFKKMINSIEFVSSNDSRKKQPSFMTSTEPEEQTQPSFMRSEESNESISSISNNENEMNFSDLEMPNQLGITQKSNELTILSHDSYINSIGHMHIIGEVENNTPNIKQFVQIIATFYDNNNKVVGTSNTYATPTDLKPDEVAPFDLILTEASIPVEQIERYTLKVSGQ